MHMGSSCHYLLLSIKNKHCHYGVILFLYVVVMLPRSTVSQASVTCAGSLKAAFMLSTNKMFCFFYLQPILYLEKNWMADEFAGGCYVGTFPPGVLTSYGK